MKICSAVTHLRALWTAAAVVYVLALHGASAAPEVHPRPDPATSTGDDADTTTKDSKFLQEGDSCPMQQQIEDLCPDLHTNVTDVKQKLTGDWVVEFGFVSASTTRAFCQRITFAAASGPCTAFASGYPQPTEHNPMPAPAKLRVLQHGLLVSPDAEEPQLKVLLVQEPFMMLAVCSEDDPLYILGVRRTAPDRASTPEPPSSLSFWMDMYDRFVRLSGPAWFLCSRLWEGGEEATAAQRGRGYDFTDSSAR